MKISLHEEQGKSGNIDYASLDALTLDIANDFIK